MPCRPSLSFAAPLALLLPAGAAAQVLAGPDIIVTAARIEQPRSQVGQSVTVIDAARIAERQSVSVTDLLATVPGVSVVRYGGVGTVGTVFIRGADSDQTVALIDGVKLNDPSTPGGGFNWGNLLVGTIDRIEVLRGPSSVIWGSQAIGGVVNVISAAPGEQPRVNARAEAGYRGTRQLAGNVSGRAGPLGYSAGAAWLRADGISAFSEARGGRERDGYRRRGGNLTLDLPLGDAVTLDARGYYSDGRVGQDGYPPPDYSFGDTRETARTRELVGYAGARVRALGGRFTSRAGIALTDTRRRNRDPDGFVAETFAGTGRNQRIDYQGVLALDPAVTATFGAERETSRYAAASYGGPVGRARARLDSGYAQVAVRPVAGLTLTGGARHDRHDRFGGATSLAASGAFASSDGLTEVRASYAEGFRAPSLYQLSGDYGNAALAPERARGWDAGVVRRTPGGTVEAAVTLFGRRTRNLIAFVDCPGQAGICAGRPYGTYDNVARASARGVEASVALRPVPQLRVEANYTLLDARDRSGGAFDGRRLARRPMHSVNATVDWTGPGGIAIGASLAHVGGSFDNLANTSRLEGYVLADLRAALPVGEAAELFARVENLFDARYETVRLYGSPGRAAYAGVRLRL